MEYVRYPEHLVFGLDIGTRSIVGTVGYKDKEDNFIVVAQYVKEHETRAMLDGQIHDIDKVSETISLVKEKLETQIGRKLTEVCIAAAGRVLITVTVKADYEFQNETVVNEEHIHSLDLLGVEKAYDTFREQLKDEKINYYCVGYSVIRYYLNGYSILKLDGHKANAISTELLATFLPDEVVDSLYIAVEKAGLQVANLTLEPIAAINVAIPEKFRLLNIALVDVGAGTSDISITKDGSIIAYGMIPFAGDELTEAIVQKYLVEFNEAEKIKLSCLRKKSVSFKDIMGIKYKVSTEEIIEAVSDTIHNITKSIADKIIELNGNRSVSAVFVVGGGGKIPGFVKCLAEYLNLPYDRVALRGEEVLGSVNFLQNNIKKDPLLVTPIGICLNFYDQKNNFIFVNVNGERVKLYDNNKLTIVDAALQVGYPNEKLFPRRGKEINFTLNGIKRMIRGELGEAAIVKLNGKVVGISHSIEQNDRIEIIESTIGNDAKYEMKQLAEYNSIITFNVNGQAISCPKFATANGELVSEFYSIQDNDNITILDYYTLEQVLSFMDIEYTGTIKVNNVTAALDEKIYDKFTIQCDIRSENYFINSEDFEYELGNLENELENYQDEYESLDNKQYKDTQQDNTQQDNTQENVTQQNVTQQNITQQKATQQIKDKQLTLDIMIKVNNQPITLKNKKEYIFVDILDFYPFDVSRYRGSEIVMNVNGQHAEFTTPIKENDNIELYWKE